MHHDTLSLWCNRTNTYKILTQFLRKDKIGLGVRIKKLEKGIDSDNYDEIVSEMKLPQRHLRNVDKCYIIFHNNFFPIILGVAYIDNATGRWKV